LHGSDSLDAANREIEFFFKGVQWPLSRSLYFPLRLGNIC
jgi:hypothetical protein